MNQKPQDMPEMKKLQMTRSLMFLKEIKIEKNLFLLLSETLGMNPKLHIKPFILLIP